MKALIILSHSWSPFIYLYWENWHFGGLVRPFGVFSRERNLPVSRELICNTTLLQNYPYPILWHMVKVNYKDKLVYKVYIWVIWRIIFGKRRHFCIRTIWCCLQDLLTLGRLFVLCSYVTYLGILIGLVDLRKTFAHKRHTRLRGIHDKGPIIFLSYGVSNTNDGVCVSGSTHMCTTCHSSTVI